MSAREFLPGSFVVSSSRGNYYQGPNSSTAAGKSKKRGRKGNREEFIYEMQDPLEEYLVREESARKILHGKFVVSSSRAILF